MDGGPVECLRTLFGDQARGIEVSAKGRRTLAAKLSGRLDERYFFGEVFSSPHQKIFTRINLATHGYKICAKDPKLADFKPQILSDIEIKLPASVVNKRLTPLIVEQAVIDQLEDVLLQTAELIRLEVEHEAREASKQGEKKDKETKKEEKKQQTEGPLRMPDINDDVVAGELKRILDLKKMAYAGEGSFGLVYTAKLARPIVDRMCKGLQNWLGQTEAGLKKDYIALKVASSSDTDTLAEKLAEAKDEVALLRKVRHPNIIKLVALHNLPIPITSCNIVALEFEYMSMNLRDYLLTDVQPNKKHRQTMRQVIREIGGAIAFMHEKNIAHHDIKLENIMFKQHKVAGDEREHMTFKLIDFGLASQYDLELNYDQVSTPKFCGTVPYMPLEVAVNMVKNICYNPFKADVYSFGICLFSMACFTEPDGFAAESINIPGWVYTKLAELKAERTLEYLEHHDPQLLSIIESMIHKYPTFRPDIKKVLEKLQQQ